MARKWVLLATIIALTLLVDQVTKRIITTQLMLGESIQPIPALASVFQITRSENTGAAFGFLSQAGDVFFVIALVVVFAMIVFYPRIPANARVTRYAIGLVCGGALGNAVDRVQHGAVIDFIHYIIPGVVSNVSNIADHAIVFGVILIFIESWRMDAKKEAPAPAETEQHPPT